MKRVFKCSKQWAQMNSLLHLYVNTRNFFWFTLYTKDIRCVKEQCHFLVLRSGTACLKENVLHLICLVSLLRKSFFFFFTWFWLHRVFFINLRRQLPIYLFSHEYFMLLVCSFLCNRFDPWKNSEKIQSHFNFDSGKKSHDCKLFFKLRDCWWAISRKD